MTMAEQMEAARDRQASFRLFAAKDGKSLLSARGGLYASKIEDRSTNISGAGIGFAICGECGGGVRGD
jgi:hypothetical protein